MYSIFKSSSFMFCQNLIETLYLMLYFLIGNSSQNGYNGKFLNVNNQFNVTNVRKIKVYYGIS